jgi:hypothetical protein
MLFPVELTHNLQDIARLADTLGRNVPQAEIGLRGSGSNGDIPLGRQSKQWYTD